MTSTEGKQGNSKENKTRWYQYVTVWAAVMAGIAAALAAGINAYQAYLIRQNNIVSQSAFVSAKSVKLFPRQTTPTGLRSWEIEIIWENYGNTFASDVTASRAGYPAEPGSPSAPPTKFDEVPSFFLAPHAETIAEFITIAPDAVRAILDKGTSKNRHFPPPRKSDSRFSYSERGRLAWDSLASSI
jgi:hypothetical protein